MKHIKLKRGKHCFMYGNLKVFDSVPVAKDHPISKDIMWGKVSLQEATKIQNILYLEGLAPRVWDIRKVRFLNNFYLAQALDVVAGDHPTDKQATDLYEKVKVIASQYGIESISDKVSKYDFIDGKLIDFNTLKFTSGYRDVLRKKYTDLARYGKIYYHNIPEWKLVNSPRDNIRRTQWMQLESIDIKGKVFTDLGSAGGYFCRYAKDRGAKRVVGIDYANKGSDDPVKASYLASFALGYHDIEYRNIDLTQRPEIEKSDIVLFLSMAYHVGIPDWLPEMINDDGLLVFEDNTKNRDAHKRLDRLFKSVKKIGIAEDHGNKPIYWCKK